MNRDNRNAIIIGLLIAVAFMSVGYALLSTKIDNDNLTTSMSSSKNGDVRITTISSVETTGSATDIKSYISDKNKITVNPKLIEQGDSVNYTVNFANNGSEPVELDSIEFDKYSGSYIYTINNLNAGDVINPGESRMFTLGISYNDNLLGEPAESIGEIEITLNFNK